MKLYEMITAENWRKGSKGFGDPSQSGCIMHHAEVLGLGFQTGEPYFWHLAEAIRVCYPERFSDTHTVSRFNDHPDTTVEDVIRVCKVAGV